MIELAFIVCLRGMPDQCELRSISYLPDVTLMGCMMQAQTQLAQWSERPLRNGPSSVNLHFEVLAPKDDIVLLQWLIQHAQVAQAKIAGFRRALSEQHPNLTVARWSCQYAAERPVKA